MTPPRSYHTRSSSLSRVLVASGPTSHAVGTARCGSDGHRVHRRSAMSNSIDLSIGPRASRVQRAGRNREGGHATRPAHVLLSTQPPFSCAKRSTTCALVAEPPTRPGAAQAGSARADYRFPFVHAYIVLSAAGGCSCRCGDMNGRERRARQHMKLWSGNSNVSSETYGRYGPLAARAVRVFV